MLARSTNSIDDIVPGVELALLKADPTVSVTIGVERQTDLLKSTLDDFVSVYNTVWQTLKSAREELGADYALRRFEREYAAITTATLTDHGAISSLNEIGVFTNRDGSIAINRDRLDAALAADADAVEALFRPASDADPATNPGLSGVLKTLEKAMVDDGGTLDATQDRLNALAAEMAKEREKIEGREADYRALLERQFGGMDARLASLRATQSYLEQQIRIWNGGD
jgi:flagellar hook-associated protein 2